MPATRLVQHYLDRHCRQGATRVAVADASDSLTYGELETRSNRLANALIEREVGRQDRVVLCLQRSVQCLPALLGILKAGATYVPLDPKTPDQRRRAILEDCRPRAVVCDRTTRNLFAGDPPAGNASPAVVLDPAEALDSSADRPACRNLDNDLAYVMYTSGSTGQPKGVMITHRNVCAYIDWAVDRFGLDDADRILCTAPFHFDMSTFDIHATLKSGGTLCIASESMLLFPQQLVSFIEERTITVWKGVASLLMYLARAGVLTPERMPTLRTVMFAGEALPTRYLMEWMRNYPEKCFFNAYGPTEATGVSLCHRIERIPQGAGERVPIGRPRADTRVLLLNDDLSPVGEGEVGELCLAGPCLAKGYLNDPLKTAQAFLEPGPGSSVTERCYRTGDLARQRSDGTFEYVSRKDHQVKIMGYRIELGEIEHTLVAIDGIDDAVVVVETEEHSGLEELVAYYEAAADLPLSALLAEIRRSLPPYMAPRRYRRVAGIPRNNRGKVAREALREAHLQYDGCNADPA
jgi:amino acid adenylation domain-containing protein